MFHIFENNITVGIHLNGFDQMILMNMYKICFYRALKKLSYNYNQTPTLPVYLHVNHLQSVIKWENIFLRTEERDLPFDCSSSCSLLFYYF